LGSRKYVIIHFQFAVEVCLALILSLACSASAMAFDYSCSNCVPPDCICASTEPPNGLAPGNTPQIILLTFDDPVYPDSYEVHQQILTNHVNPNGSPIQATFYIQARGSDYRLIQQHYGDGHEIAVHTMTHWTGTNTDIGTWRREIFGCRKALSDLAGIPIEDIRGFRAPYLHYCHNSFQAVAEAGMEYDSSIEEHVDGLTTNPSSMIWPYTLDNGLAQVANDGTPPEHLFPGLFEVPMWSLLDTQGFYLCTMDAPPGYDYDEVLDLYKRNFTNHYEGNRAPMGVFLHEHWITRKLWRVDAINEFIEWALTHDDVWFVSTHALVEYMRTPVDAASAAAFPPFITTPRTIAPTSAVVTCTYTNGVFHTCGECPPVYPMPDTIYKKAGPATGGVAWIEITQPYGDSYGAHLVVSNPTDKAIINWPASFTVGAGEVTEFWGNGTGTVSGSLVQTYPSDLESRRLDPGETDYVGFWVENTGGITNVANLQVDFQSMIPQTPVLERVTCERNNRVRAEWDDSAPGYRLYFTTNLQLTGWQSLADVYGRTAFATSLPPDTATVYFRLKALP